MIDDKRESKMMRISLKTDVRRVRSANGNQCLHDDAAAAGLVYIVVPGTIAWQDGCGSSVDCWCGCGCGLQWRWVQVRLGMQVLQLHVLDPLLLCLIVRVGGSLTASAAGS